MSDLLVKDLKEILEGVDENLPVATLGHYGEPFFYHRGDFYVSQNATTREGPEFFVVMQQDIGPEPD